MVRLHATSPSCSTCELRGGPRRFDSERDDDLVVQQQVRCDVLAAREVLTCLPQCPRDRLLPWCEAAHAAYPPPVPRVGDGVGEVRGQFLLEPGRASGRVQLVGHDAPQLGQVHDVAGRIVLHGRGDRTLRPVGALERLLVPVERETEDLAEQRSEPHGQAQHRCGDRGVDELRGLDPFRGERDDVVARCMQHGETCREMLLQPRHVIDRHAVEQHAGTGPTDLHERGVTEVAVGVGAFDIHADHGKVDIGECRPDTLHVIDEGDVEPFRVRPRP